MSYCINIKHPDYQLLLEQSGLKPTILKAKIATWMQENTDERFPTIEDLGITQVLYQTGLNIYQQKAKDIYFKEVYNKELTSYQIDHINKKLKEISQNIGDVDWNLRVSNTSNKLYIAGYKNAPVTMKTYYSPYANNMFRQTNSNSIEERIEELDNKLKTWAKKHGISIETIEAVMQKYPGRYNNSAIGLADFVNNLIALSNSAKIDTLPEEIAHFAIEILLNTPSVQQALEEVVTTDEYAQVKEEYKDIYTKEEDFRKEALGKILAKEIVTQFKATDNKGFWNNIKQIFTSFSNWLQSKFGKTTVSRKYIDSVIQPLAKSILNEEYLGKIEPTNNETLYSIPDPKIEHKKQFLITTVDKLKQRLVHLKRSLKTKGAVELLEKEILEIEKSIHKGESDLGIAALITLAESELSIVNASMEKMRKADSLNTTTIKNTELFISMYEDVFNNLMESLYTFEATADEIEDLKKAVEGVYSKLKDAKALNTSLYKRAAIQVVEEGNTNEYGEKIDPSFDAKIIVDTTHEDIGYWRLLVGNYKYADSKILKTAHKIVFDSIAKVKRFTTRTGNLLLSKQQAFTDAGHTIDKLIEKDKDGKPSHYFVREYQWGKYYEELNKTKESIAKVLGYTSYEDINVSLLEADAKKTYKAYWASFFKTHTKEKTVVDEATGIREKVVTPNDSYINPNYTAIMSDPVVKDYYEELIKVKREAVDKLPVNYRTEKLVYMVPPILKTTLNRLSGSESFLTKISKLGREAFFVTKDDTQFGEQSNFKHINYLNNKMVPIYFTRPLDDINDVSMDVARSVTLFAEMAENYKEMNTIAGDLGVIQSTLAQRNYFTNKKRDTTKKGIETLEYSALETLMDTHVFGIERNPYSVTIPSNSLTEKLGLADKDFSFTKFSQRLTSFIRNNNLAFNITTSLSGWLKGSGDAVIEDAIGLYTTTQSKNWARLEFAKNLMQVVGEIGKAKQSNKMHLILQEAETVSLDAMLKNSNSSRFARKVLTKDVFYTTFATGDYGIKGRITLAVYDNTRLYNNQFMTRAKFYRITAAEKGIKDTKEHRKEVQKQWDALQDKSLYNAYEVVNGQLKVKPEFEKYVTEGVLNSTKGKIEHVSTYVDGTLSPTDKGKLARSIAGDFLLMHRGWFIGMMDTRFKKEGTNQITEEEEIGTYRATGTYLKEVFWNALIKEQSLQSAYLVYPELSPVRQRAILKTVLDAFYLFIISTVAALVNLAADDDDEETFHIQYTAYQLNRLLMEQGAAWSPAELIQMIDEPVVGARFIKDVSELTEAVNFSETYKRGMYEGKSHATKWWMKKLPTRNLYELQFPELKNRFVKQLVDSKIYDLLKPEEGHSIFSIQSFKDEVIPFNEGYFNDESIDVTPAVKELENSDEYNGFN